MLILALMRLISCIGAVGCTHVERVTLVTSTLVIACDIAQTVKTASTGWDRRADLNPIIAGRTPGFVASYGVAAVAVNAVIWRLIPAGWRAVWGFGVTAVETTLVVNNARIYHEHRVGPHYRYGCW